MPLNIWSVNDQPTSAAEASSSLPIRIFDRKEESTSDLYTQNGNFVWFQIFIEILLRMDDDTAELKAELIEYFNDIYKENSKQLEKIEVFEREYSSNDAIKWYTRDMCLYRLLNKALRARNVEVLVKFGFYIRDIFHQLSDAASLEDENQQFKVYHGQIISKDEFSRLENSIGAMISFDAFISASRNPDVAYIFAGSSSDSFVSVILEININRSIQSTKPYANISPMSYFQDEDEILFMLGSVFRIVDVNYAEDNKTRQIVLDICSENDQMYRNVLEHERNKIGGFSTLFHLAQLLSRIGDYNLSEKYCRKYMTKYPEHTAACTIHLINMSALKFQSPINVKELTDALDEFRQRIDDSGIDKQAMEQKLEHQFKSLFYLQTALQYNIEGKYDLALLNQKKMLEEQLKYLTPDHPLIATSFANMGGYYYMLKDYEKTLECLQKALAIRKQSLPSTHPDLSFNNGMLGNYYEEQGKYQLALEHYTKVINILRASPASNEIWRKGYEQGIERIQNHLPNQPVS